MEARQEGDLALRRNGAESLLELWLCRADGAGAAFEVPTLVDFTTITPPGSVNSGPYD
jgi:hypothetical protein